MSEFAYTFTYTPTLTTRRAPVYVALLRASALIILWSQVQVLVGPPEIKIPASNCWDRLLVCRKKIELEL